MAQAYHILERKLCLVHEQNAPKLRPLRFVDYVIICNNIALPSCFVLIAHQNEYLISLCHLMLSIIERAKKILHNSVVFERKLCLVLGKIC